jgi:hypothetical protein
MEVVPTNDGDDDDGVVWFRCPQCQGFLPKLKGALDTQEEPEDTTPTPAEENKEDPLPWDSPAAMMQELKESSDETASADDSSGEPESDDDVLVGMAPENEPEPEVQPVVETVGDSSEPEPAPERGNKSADEDEPAEDVEPILEYAAMLAELDVAEAAPYRPWEVYEVGQCINHLAWNDCGVVVAKEDIPGGRKIIKCYFEEAGVVRLIEQAPR